MVGLVSGRRLSLVTAMAAGLWMMAAGSGAAPLFRTLDNTPFATRCTGPQGAVLLSSGTGGVQAQTAGSAATVQHSAATLRRAEFSLRRLQSAGLKSPLAEVRFPRMMYHVSAGRLALPELVAAQQTGIPLGDPTNELTFAFSGFAATDQQALESYLRSAYPKMKMVYGPPAFNMTVTIVQDSTLQTIQGGLYNASTKDRKSVV